MELNSIESQLVKRFLYGQIESLPDEILYKIELGVWIFQPLQLHLLFTPALEMSSGDSNGEPLFLSGKFGGQESYRMLLLFREKLIPYLLIRINSWECYINCNGELLTEHCDENLDSIREACERLRKRCDDEHPSVKRTKGGR